MRIAQVATLSSPVDACATGSVEGLVWLLSKRLQERGHEVTVFGTADSSPPCELIGTLPGPYGSRGAPDDWQVCEWINLSRAIELSDEFDVIHTHAYLWGLPLEAFSRAPMVHTMHVVPYQASAALWRQYPSAHVTALSASQWSAFPDLHPAAIIGHGVEPSGHTFSPGPGDYLCYLGRFTPDKGVEQAIAAARTLGLPLRIAGPYNDYFAQCVEPHLDGGLVEYVGWAGPAERDRLLGGARALLYPIQAPEAFGLVLAEAMLSGTPVAAVGLGAVPELVEEGRTGAWEPPEGDFSSAVRRCLALSRQEVRARALELFSLDRMTERYEAVFDLVAQTVLR